MILIVWSSLLIGACYGQFPRACTDDASLSTGRCCPKWPAADGSPCGETLGRGACRRVQLDDSPHSASYPFVGVDDRERWPTVYWNWTCACRDNFYGVDCSECKYGFRGSNCSERKVRIRPNILNLTQWERKRFLRALNESKNTVSERWVILVTPYIDLTKGKKIKFSNVTTQNLLTWMHYYVTRDVLLADGAVFVDEDYAHAGPAFLSWHRLFILFWERELGRLIGDEDFVFPHWDWRDLKDCGDLCTDELLGATQPGSAGILSNGSFLSSWRVICTRKHEYNKLRTVCDGSPEGPLVRNPGNNALYNALPTGEHVKTVLKLKQYDLDPYDRTANSSFRNSLEGFATPGGIPTYGGAIFLHNLVHNYMNGTCTSGSSSPNDPVFIVHHTFVDSIYETWLQKYRPNVNELPAKYAPIGHNRGSFMVPFLPLHTPADMFTLATEFGYTYDYLPADGN